MSWSNAVAWPVNHKGCTACIARPGSRCAVVGGSGSRAVNECRCRRRASAGNGGRWTLWAIVWPSGRAFRMFNIVDDYTRECVAIEVDTLPSGSPGRARARSAARGDRAAADDRLLDNGPEFTGRALDAWAYAQGRHAALHPSRQADRERVCRELQRGKLRDECLNENWFVNLADAKIGDRSLARRLQQGPAAQLARRCHAPRLCHDHGGGSPAAAGSA